MSNKRKYRSRQVRRAAERQRAKRNAKTEYAPKGNQKRKETQETDEPKLKDNWRFGIDMVVRLLAPFIRDIAERVKDIAEQVKDFFQF